MTMRENLTRKREARRLTRKQMAIRCGCSERLIAGIEEDDWITHPNIASRMAKEYGFGIRTYNQLVHEDRRAKALPNPVQPPSMKDWKGYAAWSGDCKLSMEDDLFLCGDLYQ